MKWCNWFVRQWENHSKLYEDAANNGESHIAEIHAGLIARLRDVLEKRYRVIV